ncbi:diheme cytochrome c [Sinimarinibacterium sp. CAU 1509]|uniref:diheme cytochrome c n=1 Tax=Sinimarinibacterium sp. CAU 1509 TaxID=2562283 RepID=UPI001B7F8F7B|nr:diheme cytochrome c [Sinimarinibacterium sp. CAU 1509]
MLIRFSRLALLSAGLCAVSIGTAAAEQKQFPVDPTWQAECGSCHVAYPPQLLPAASWDRIFATLGDHFGSDATLDPAVAADLLRYAQTHAGRAANPAPLRITETRWFRHEHDEVPMATWQRKAIGSPANCAACHRQADTGDFSERGIRIPR